MARPDLPWLVVAKKAFHIISAVLGNIKDRDMGFVPMDESIGAEFKPGKKVKRHNEFSTGKANIWWK